MQYTTYIGSVYNTSRPSISKTALDIKTFTKTLKSEGDSKLPCLTPAFTMNDCEIASFHRTATYNLLYQSFNTRIIHPGTPAFQSVFKSFV